MLSLPTLIMKMAALQGFLTLMTMWHLQLSARLMYTLLSDYKQNLQLKLKMLVWNCVNWVCWILLHLNTSHKPKPLLLEFPY